MCVSTTYFYGPTIQKKLPKSDEKKPKGKRARKNCQWSEKALTKNRYKQQNHKMHRERFKVMRTICNKKITNNTATRKSAYEKLLQVAKSNNVPRKWKILRYIVKYCKIKTCNPKKLAKYQYVYQWLSVSKKLSFCWKSFRGGHHYSFVAYSQS